MNSGARIAVFLLAASISGAGCGNTKSATNPDLSMCTSSGGFVSGPVDEHCAASDAGPAMVQSTSQADCYEKPDGGGDAVTDYGDTMYNSEGDDDDCKYHVKVTAMPICRNFDTTFTVVATRKIDGQPLTGANTIAEVFLSDTHSGIVNNMTTKEGPPGTYEIGPVEFDEAGTWTVRFHFYENCYDYADDSPHGHAAFYVNVQ